MKLRAKAFAPRASSARLCFLHLTFVRCTSNIATVKTFDLFAEFLEPIRIAAMFVDHFCDPAKRFVGVHAIRPAAFQRGSGRSISAMADFMARLDCENEPLVGLQSRRLG
ncbi:hypothetical protein [Methylocystis echinoides]|uniref:hypothetical protein n=1 Tax=Methylocystis echinoides TaxID=29468 RepID=UPI0024918399|nr:hypothetical protein [Methylocystis echinoides]